MVRTALYLLAGLLLGLAIHLVVILILPTLATNTLTTQLTALAALDKVSLIPPVAPGAANPLHLDPELDYAICRLDLRNGPGEVEGTLPLAFWSVGIYDTTGTVIYSTTNRDGIGQTLDLGVFDPGQTRLLAEQKIDIDSGLLIVESRTDDIFVVVRLAPPQPAMKARYAGLLSKLTCRNLKT
jgi:uncharacterized membrane protein